MIVVFDISMTGQQRQWVNDTIARCTYPLDALTATVTFEIVAEPPCAGHKDLMCTSDEGGGNFTVHIRDGLDSPTGSVALMFPHPAADIKTFFQECIMHELGHVIAFTYLTTDDLKTTVAGYFQHDGASGEGSPLGTLADWDSLDDAWEDRIQEAVAEVIKDASLDSVHRLYDNRTNWDILEAHFQDFASGVSG